MKGTIILLAVISLFLGLVIGGAVIGNIYPPIFKISAPIVCPQGQVNIESHKYSYKPGSVSVQHKVYCQASTDSQKQDVTFSAVMVTCLIFSGIFFVLLVANTFIQRIRTKQGDVPQEIPQAVQTAIAPEKPEAAQDPGNVLRKLKELYESGLITEQEYQAKKAEILSKM